MSEFDGITDFAGWADKLDELLTAADLVAEAGTGDERRAVRTRLKDFVLHSRPSSPDIEELDRIASETRTALALSSIQKRVQSISDRSGELARLTKQIRVRAEDGRARAQLIALEPARKVVSNTTATIEALKALEAELSSESDANLLQQIQAVLGKLQELRQLIETS